VVAAECCYGAELYSPSIAHGKPGIYATYLRRGAYAFFGSSTTAFGPSEGNGEADYICQFFLQEVLAGSSTGRAALEARQKFVAWTTILDPYNLKTLAQFNLMGDPSIHPVLPRTHKLAKSKVYRKVFPSAELIPPGRTLRRQKLARNGAALALVAAARPARRLATRGKVRRALLAAARQSRLRKVSFTAYVADAPAPRLYSTSRLQAVRGSEVHVAIGKRTIRRPDGIAATQFVALMATVQDGEIVRLRRLHGR
jgi:hypothetical protein